MAKNLFNKITENVTENIKETGNIINKTANIANVLDVDKLDFRNSIRGKILLLYKNYRNRYEGWVLPKGTVEQGEEYKDTAIREVLEETGATATIIQYVGKSQYSFTIPEDTVEKSVHWYLMMGESYYSKPQREEYFTDSGYYKYHEAYHLLKFSNEKQILEKAYNEYLDLKKSNLWGTHKYF